MLPTPNKTYQITQEYITGASGTEVGQKYYLAFKNRLTGPVLNPWVVMRSCAKVGGTTWTTSASDLWTSYNEVYFGDSGKYPWVVMKQSAIAPNFQVLFWCRSAVSWDMYVSESAGFTGGSELVRPTATDEIQICTNEETGTSGYDNVHQFVWVSTDGEVTFLVSYNSNRTYVFLTVQKPKNPVSGWVNPWFVTVMGSSNATWHPLTPDQLEDTGYTKAARGDLRYTYEGISTLAMGEDTFTGPDDINAGTPYNLYPIGLLSETLGFRGRKGEVYDAWFTVWNDESTMPDDLSRQFIVCDRLALPWDGSQPEFY